MLVTGPVGNAPIGVESERAAGFSPCEAAACFRRDPYPKRVPWFSGGSANHVGETQRQRLTRSSPVLGDVPVGRGGRDWRDDDRDTRGGRAPFERGRQGG